MPKEFQDEEPTKPEAYETLVETAVKWRERITRENLQVHAPAVEEAEKYRQEISKERFS